MSEDTTGPQPVWDVGKHGRRLSDPNVVKLYERVKQLEEKLRRLEDLPTRVAVSEAAYERTERDLQDMNARFDTANREMQTASVSAAQQRGESLWPNRLLFAAIVAIVGVIGAALGRLLLK